MKTTPTPTNRLSIYARNSDDRGLDLGLTVTGHLAAPLSDGLQGVVVEHGGDGIWDVVCDGSWSEGTVTRVRVTAEDDGLDYDITAQLLHALRGHTGPVDLRGSLVPGVADNDSEFVSFSSGSGAEDSNDVDEDGPHPEDDEPSPEFDEPEVDESTAAPFASFILRRDPFVLVPGTEEGADFLNERCVGTDGVAECEDEAHEGEQVATPVDLVAVEDGCPGADGVVWLLEYDGRHYGCTSEDFRDGMTNWRPVTAAVPAPAVKVKLG